MTSAPWFAADALLGRNDLLREIGYFASPWAVRPPSKPASAAEWQRCSLTSQRMLEGLIGAKPVF